MKRKLSFDDVDPVLLLGRNDANLRMIQDSFHATVTARDNEVTVSG